MREWAAGSWRRELDAPGCESVVYVFTPFCGTCAAARRMLEVVQAMRPDLAIAAANLNLMPGLAEAFRIESVPCLLIREADGAWSKLYRFGSVAHLADRLRTVVGKDGAPNQGEERKS